MRKRRASRLPVRRLYRGNYGVVKAVCSTTFRLADR
jgi:hypothetical protein